MLHLSVLEDSRSFVRRNVLASFYSPLQSCNTEFIWENVFQSGKSPVILTRLEKSEKITQNTGKLKGISDNVISFFQ